MSQAKIGRFELGRKLGEGGMGAVYLATDPALGRDVALKVLPEAFAADPVLMARFEREARLLATLNHPNIAIIHGFEVSQGHRALVMEHVPGEDLSQRVKRGALPLEEALSIGVQIARGLEAAHQKGIVHRDLKPANVRITPEGVVKVLDFGIAKSLDAEAAGAAEHTPTISLHQTMQGVILGTAAYMSPEQARGKPVDARTDVFSFGCLLFEMLAGERAFEGEDVSEILASVIKKDIRWSRFPSSIPEPLRRVVARCLAGSLDDRYQAIGDVRYELEQFLDRPELLSPVDAVGARRSVWGWVGLGLVAGGLAGAGFVVWRMRPVSDLRVSPLVKFHLDAPGVDDIALAPDGSRIAYTSGGRAWIRRLDRLHPEEMRLPWEATPLTFTRDSGALIVYKPNRKNGELWALPADGGEPRLVGTPPDQGFVWGASPGDDGHVLIGMATAGIVSMPIAGGAVTTLIAPQPGETLVAPHLLPDGRTILFTEATHGRIETWDGRKRRVVLAMEGDRIFDAVYSASGHLYFRHTGGKSQVGTWAVPFDAKTGRTTGSPVRIAPYGLVYVADFGLVAYEEIMVDRAPRQLVWVGRDGSVLGSVGDPLAGLSYPALSPDGRRIAAVGVPDETGFLDVFVFDRTSGVRYPLSDGAGSDRFPFWRDARTLGFTTWAAGVRHLRERDIDGTGPVRLVSDRATNAGASRDGRLTWFSYEGLRTFERSVESAKTIVDGGWHFADFSPNGRFLASSRLGEPGIFVRPYPESAGVVALTSRPTSGLRFSADGRELLFWTIDGEFVAVPFDTTASDPRPGPPHILFKAATRRLLTGPDFDVAPDGRFLMCQNVSEPNAPKDPGIVMIQNWDREFDN